MFYVNDEPEGKFLYTETIKLYFLYTYLKVLVHQSTWEFFWKNSVAYFPKGIIKYYMHVRVLVLLCIYVLAQNDSVAWHCFLLLPNGIDYVSTELLALRCPYTEKRTIPTRAACFPTGNEDYMHNSSAEWRYRE